MSIVRIKDVWLKNGATAECVRNYLIHSAAVIDATLSFSVDLHGGFESELVVAIDDDHPHSDSVHDDVQEMLIQARLDFVQCGILQSLAWSFSSPAQTSKLKELLEAKKI